MADASTVEDLQPGDHACLTFSDADERLDIVTAFVRDGLRLGQKVLCLTDSIPEAVLRQELEHRGLPAAQAAEAGRLSLTASAQTYLPEGSFMPARVISTLRAHIEQARREGHRGLRVTGDMCWALRPVTGVDELMAYESQFTTLLADERATAVCQYDRQCFDTVSLAGVTANHPLAVAAVTYHDDALLRICRQHVPPGLRVAGELDYRAVEAFTRALTESLALDEHVHVNLARLRFIDAVAAGALIQAALSLSAGQRMTVRCQWLIHRVLQTLGAQQITGLRMAVVDDD